MDLKRYFQTAPRTDLIFIGAFAALFAVSAAVAGLTPEDILIRPWARVYVDFVAGLIPAVARVPEFSPLPGVAQFYFAVMWLTVPLMFGIYIYVFVKAPPYRRNEVFRQARGKLKWIGMVIFLSVLLYYGAYLQPLGTPPGAWLTRLQMSSRFGLGCYGGMEFGAIPMAAGFLVILVLNWRRLLLQKTSDTSSS